MTGGRVVVLGRTGRNFAAGMSGGLRTCTTRTAASGTAATPSSSTSSRWPRPDEQEVKDLISEHVARTGSLVGRNVLASWERGARERFVKVMPRDYRRVLEERAAAAAAEGELSEAAPA